MGRLRVSVILADECAARACRLEVTSGNAGFSGACDLHADEPQWQTDGFQAGWWLGPSGGAGWLEQAWARTWHLRAGRSVEAVLPEVAFGQVVVRALLEEVAGQADAVVAAEQSITVNCRPMPLRRLQRRRPGVGFAMRGTGS